MGVLEGSIAEPRRRRAAPAHRLPSTAAQDEGQQRRRLRTAALVAAVVVPACVLLATSGALNSFYSQLVDDAAQLGAAVFASWCCWSTWRRDVRAGRPRSVWLWRLLLFVGITGWACGQALWSWYQLVGNEPLPSPSLADVGYFTLPLFAVPAVLALPSPSSPGGAADASGPAAGGARGRLLLTLDALVIVGSLFVLTWSTSLGAAVHAGAPTRTEFAVAVGYPVTDLIMVVIVLLIAVFRRPRHPQVLLLLGAGLVALSVSDSFFLYLVSLDEPTMPPLYDVGFVAGPVLIGLAALAPESASRPRGPAQEAREAMWFMLLPYLPLSAIGLLVVAQQVTGIQVDPAQTYSLIALVGIVVVRQLMTLAENLELLRRVREGQERLHHQAFHDWLTGLPNRALFRDQLEQAVERQSSRRRRLAVLFFDLDDFKEVNDTLGHGAGDDLLKVTAQRLRRCVPDGDTVARLGGDEFAVVLSDVQEDAEASPAATSERILAALGRSVVLAGRAITPRASAGLIVVDPGEAAVTADLLLHQADAAMYTAKRAGKGQLVTRLPGAGGGASEDLATRLSRVLHAPASAPEALGLVYQPVVRLSDGTPVAVEALTRWRHRETETVPPEFLIHAAESAGLMGRLQEWILRQACRDVADVRGAGWSHVAVHVNVPASLLADARLVTQVRTALADCGLSGAALVLEVTETGSIDDFAAAVDVLDGVRRLGVRVALDDFGAGHSNLNHLLRLPVDILKLDRALTTEVVDPGRAQAISAGAVQMARRLRIPIIAEGVEQPEQASRLADLGCDYAQGFLFSPPLPMADLSPAALTPLAGSPVRPSAPQTVPRSVRAW